MSKQTLPEAVDELSRTFHQIIDPPMLSVLRFINRRLPERLRESELFRTHTATAYPVGEIWVDRDGHRFRITRHAGPYAGTTIVYGVAHEEEITGDGSGHALPPLIEGYSPKRSDQVAHKEETPNDG